MRITRIRDDQGKVWTLSNGDVTMVVNHSRAPVESFIEIGIQPSSDVAAAERIINEAGQTLFESESDRRLVSTPSVVGISGWDSARVIIRVAITVDPKFLGAEQLKVRKAIHARLVDAGIQLA